MPSKSPAQARLMRAVAHGWKKPGGGGPTRAVAKEFVEADKRRGKVQSYQFGGVTSPAMVGAMSRYRPRKSTGLQAPNAKPMAPRQPSTRMPPAGATRQVHNLMNQRRPQPVKMQRRIAPPPNKYPGGGTPGTGRRNPMIRQMNNNARRPMMRGATSYFRR